MKRHRGRTLLLFSALLAAGIMTFFFLSGTLWLKPGQSKEERPENAVENSLKAGRKEAAESEAKPGGKSRTGSGTGSGDNSGTGSGNKLGAGSGDKSGAGSGDKSGTGSGNKSGAGSGDNSGNESGGGSGTEPGYQPGGKPAEAAGENAKRPGADLAFVGDILLSDGVVAAYGRNRKEGIVSGEIAEILENADIFFANQEFPFTVRGKQAPDKQFTFRVPPEKVSVFRELGIDGVTLANNHTLDYGPEGLLDSMDVLRDAGIASVGAGKDLEEAKEIGYQEAGGIRFAFLGASRVIPVVEWNAGKNFPGMLTTYDPTLLTEQIRKAERKADVVIVYVHWGIEREEYPQDYQRELAKQYVDAGADLVIGSHPHCLQGIEYYKGVPIVYSLGNFIFGESISKTAVLQVHVDDQHRIELTLLPCRASGFRTEEISAGAERQNFYQYMEQLSFDSSISDTGRVAPK